MRGGRVCSAANLCCQQHTGCQARGRPSRRVARAWGGAGVGCHVRLELPLPSHEQTANQITAQQEGAGSTGLSNLKSKQPGSSAPGQSGAGRRAGRRGCHSDSIIEGVQGGDGDAGASAGGARAGARTAFLCMHTVPHISCGGAGSRVRLAGGRLYSQKKRP